MSCGCGGWCRRRHDSVNAELGAYATGQRGTADAECILPYASDRLPQARLDTLVRTAKATGRSILDVTVVSPLTQEQLRSGQASRVPGAAAAVAACHKRAKYPLIEVVPFVLEHFGRLGEDARAFIKRLAPATGSARSAAIAHAYQALSCALQRANADAVIAAAGRLQPAVL